MTAAVNASPPEKEQLNNEALTLLRRNLAMAEDRRPRDPDWIASANLRLGAVLDAMKRSEEAERNLRIAVSVEEKSYGTESPKLIDALHLLAVHSQNEDRQDEAISLFRRELLLRQQSDRLDELDAADTLFRLGVLETQFGNAREAEGLLRRAIFVLWNEAQDISLEGSSKTTVKDQLNAASKAYEALLKKLSIDNIEERIESAKRSKEPLRGEKPTSIRQEGKILKKKNSSLKSPFKW
jgi:tetratricopeptide (TPR) repeat protein